MSGPIVVVGSLNMDLVTRVDRFPQPGETLHGHSSFRAAGGKGANQAVAAGKLGAVVEMVGRVGADDFGAALRQSLQAAGVGTTYVQPTAGISTGVALILVDAAGENVIVLDGGANSRLMPADVDAARPVIAGAGLLLLQLEVPLPTVERAAAVAHAAGVPVLLNAAPAARLPADLLRLVDTLVVNRTELAIVAGSGDSVTGMATGLLDLGPRAVLVTLGREGALLVRREGVIRQSAFAVAAVDTTAAGDAYMGAYAAAHLAGQAAAHCLRFASAAAAVKVTRPGAQLGLPTRQEVEAFLAAHP